MQERGRGNQRLRRLLDFDSVQLDVECAKPLMKRKKRAKNDSPPFSPGGRQRCLLRPRLRQVIARVDKDVDHRCRALSVKERLVSAPAALNQSQPARQEGQVAAHLVVLGLLAVVTCNLVKCDRVDVERRVRTIHHQFVRRND